MENRIDELFKSKLEHYSTLPSTIAWQKIELNLIKKSSPINWLRIAAVFFLFGCLITALYWMQTNQSNKIAPSLSQQKEKVDPPKLISEETKTRQEKNSATTFKSSQFQNKIAKRIPQSIPVLKKIEDVSSVKIEEAKQEKTEELMIPVPEVAKIEVTSVTIEKPIVLEFTLSPVESVVFTKIETKNSGLQKFFTKAKEIKNGEGGIDLAELTSKLFASNHKQDKTNIN